MNRTILTTFYRLLSTDRLDVGLLFQVGARHRESPLARERKIQRRSAWLTRSLVKQRQDSDIDVRFPELSV
jgi:hypothetical protein